MISSRTVGLAVAVWLVGGAVAVLALISGAAPANPAANVVDSAGNLRVPAGYETVYQALGSWAIAADNGQGSKRSTPSSLPGSNRRLSEDGALPRWRRSGEGGLHDLDE
jgi:hypothetical protein